MAVSLNSQSLLKPFDLLMTFGFFGLLLRHSIWSHVSYGLIVGQIKYFKSVCTQERTNHHSLCVTNPLMYCEWYFLFFCLWLRIATMHDRQTLTYCTFLCPLTSSDDSELEYTCSIPPYEMLYAHRIYEYFGFRISIPTRDLKQTTSCHISVSRIVVRDSLWIHGLTQLSTLSFSKFQVGLRMEIKYNLFLKRKMLGMINQKYV